MTDDVKTVLVTGSTDGIGRATAAELSRRGMRVLVHARNEARGRDAIERIAQPAGGERLELVVSDFTSLSQIRRMARDIRSRFDRLDVLVNNAGVYRRSRHETEDGLEETFQVNFLSQHLLTHLLLDLLRQSAPARVVNISSVAHFSVDEVDFGNLQAERYYDGYDAYATSKLAIVCFTYEMARRIDPRELTVNCMHPGVIDTKLLRSGFPLSRGAPPEVGAANESYVATAAELEGVTGTYFDKQQPIESSPLTYDPEIRRGLWEVAEELSGPGREQAA
ncbi:MAG: SDR family NAD(P)-dependent oxidoreductase [Actinobacteria bacterium]|nr:MAG: SDR family NAD(P)-dependent oxidoreductase [Actinomycetota bacterium]